MFTYAYKIAKGRSVSTEALWKVDVPLDSRLKKLFPTVKEWRALCQEVEIPPIKIDGLIWTVMGGESEIPKEISKKAEILKKELSRS
jgi:DNA-(apurinic or apyrimidinic site) lyase